MTKIDRIVRDIRNGDSDAWYELNRAADASWLPRLHRLLKRKGDFWLREAASEPIIRMEGLRSLPQLLHALDLGRHEGHDNDSLASNLVTLVSMNAREAAPILLMMLGAKRARERQDGAWLLGHIHEEITPEPLMGVLADPDPGVRGAVLGALSGFKGRPEIREALLAAVQDPEAKVRSMAASCLGYYHDKSVRPVLRGALHDTDEHVRFAAKVALRNLPK